MSRGRASSDLAACLALRDARAKENAMARARMLSNQDLESVLLVDARARGRDGVDWVEYFRAVGVNYP